MLVHVTTTVVVTYGRLDQDANIRQKSEYRFEMNEQSDAAFLELAELIRRHRGELAATLAPPEPPKEL